MGNAQAQVGRTGTVGRHLVEVVKYLGEGGSSFIFLVKDAKSGGLYVLKRVVANDANSMKLIESEINLQQRFAHASVVQFIDYQQQKDRRETEVFILMEYCPGGHLYDNMRKMGEKRFTQEQLLTTFRSLCVPIQLLHHHDPPVAHRDIKLENFLLAKNNMYKLCDFGSCVEGPRTLESKQDRINEIDLVEKRTTAMYRSPELADIEGTAMFGAARLTEAVDIWALGCVLFNMAFFRPPFPPEGLRTSKYTVPAHSYSKDLPLLLKRMLAEDVDERATIDEVIACVDALLAAEPLPKRGTSVASAQSRPQAAPQAVARAEPAPAPATVETFADFASFAPAASGGFDTFAAPPVAFDAFAAAPTAPVATGHDPFGAPPAPANKVLDTFGFLVSPTNAAAPEKQTQARDAFSAFEELDKPPAMPWDPSQKHQPLSPMGLHNLQSPTHGQPFSPTQGGMPYAARNPLYPGQPA
ncbi:hypothetical protein ACHHYP_14691, partial [Achlya hypogyna]